MKQILIPKKGKMDIFPVILWTWVRYLGTEIAVKYPENKYSLKIITIIPV